MKINYFLIATINVVTLIAIAFFSVSCEGFKKPEDIEKRRIAINTMDVYIGRIRTNHNSINDAFKRTGSGFGSGIAGHASEIEDLAQKILDAGVILSSSDFQLIKREAIELQHIAHELRHEAERKNYSEAHQYAEEMERHINTLEKDIQKLR